MQCKSEELLRFLKGEYQDYTTNDTMDLSPCDKKQ